MCLPNGVGESKFSEDVIAVHLAERVGDQLESSAVGIAEVQRDLAVLDQFDTGLGQLGAQLRPLGRFDADRDVVEAAEYFLVRAHVETREVEEGRRLPLPMSKKKCDDPG